MKQTKIISITPKNLVLQNILFISPHMISLTIKCIVSSLYYCNVRLFNCTQHGNILFLCCQYLGSNKPSHISDTPGRGAQQKDSVTVMDTLPWLTAKKNKRIFSRICKCIILSIWLFDQLFIYQEN